MSAGYVAKAIWLAMHSEPEKVPLFKRKHSSDPGDQRHAKDTKTLPTGQMSKRTNTVVACAFAYSRLKGNGQPGLSCAEACVGCSSQRSSPPSACPEGSRLSGASRDSGLYPLLLCHPHALVS
ncbi:unnamed protein product [Pleuronectes platessa]|uniref:Uncharacterized protein n=1 Tax=Pleuronectes platessa TaxID=8262 RepID=A0A9N7VKZ9_PLEPL|nr:unnamed protein product [Pleuronectes platessa]